AAAGLASAPSEKKSRFKLFLFLFLLAALGAGGGYGYHWYQVQKFIRGEWAKARTALHLGTPAGYADARKAAERILKKRPKHPGALAALGMVDAAISIEFGQDLRAKAKKALGKTKGRDSEWRTATQGFLALIADPSSAVGYLQKGIEVFPKSALLRYLEGRALVATEKDQRAADIFQAALKIAPDFVSARLALASLVGKQDKGYDRAAQIFNEVLKGHPGHVQALVERARLRARHNKEIDGAITDMKHIAGDLAAKAGPGQLGWAQLVLAQVNRQRGTIKGMASALDAAIQSPPCCDSFFRYELAGELMGLFRFRDAYGEMKQAIALNPHDPHYLQRAGRLLLAMGRTKEAAAQINKAPAGQPETKVLAARLLYAKRRYQDAEAAFKPLLAEKKVGTEAQLYRAMALVKLRRTTAALAALASLAKKQPTLDTVHLFKGMILLQIRDYKKAEVALKKAWHINKLDPRTPTFLGHVSLAIHDIDRAAKRYERALKSRPDFAPAHIALGHLRWQIGDLPAARARLAKVHKADRSLISYLVLKTRVALAERHLDAAQKVLQEIVQLHPPKMLLARLRGEVALAQKKGKVAMALLVKVSKADPKDGELLVLVGQAQTLARKLDDAYDTFHAVLKIDPGQPEALLELGRIAIKDGELSLAIRRLKEAQVQMGKRHRLKRQRAEVFSALAQAFLAQKDTGRAMSNLQDAMDLDPSAAEPQYRMGRTYDILDRPGRSVGYYQKALVNDPTYLLAYRRLVLAYAKLNDKANAVKYLNLYVSKAPKAKDVGELQKKIGGLK
ncbi:MAG: tetratricopeptide repeat protein, partial [Deltaproteobacteria bacterium]|nr:tetratricopeptide repeat protein [Deltaproteobacteria bacterium]